MSLFTDFMTSPTTWLFIVLFFAAGEVLLFVKEKKGVNFECLVAVALWLLASRIGYLYGQDSWWVTETRLVDFAWMNGLSFFLLLLALLFVNQIITNIEERGSMHFLLFGIMILISPIWAFGHFGLFCIMVYCY